MSKFSACLVALLSLVCAPLFSAADTLKLVSDSGQNVGGEIIYPYSFSINGASGLKDLMCLNMNLTVSPGESWNVTVGAVPLDSSQNSINYRADAWIYSQLGSNGYTNAEVQYAVWDIFDQSDVNGHAGFDATAQQLVKTGLTMAQNKALVSSGFFSGYTLYAPTSDQTGWTYGQPQTFLGTSPVPEPSSLLLLGSGLLGSAGMLRRRLVRL